MPTARNPIEAPQAAAPRFGLLASITPETTPFSVWKLGISYSPEGCGSGQVNDPCDMVDVDFEDRPAIVEWNPYPISVAERCTLRSPLSDEELEGRALRKLNSLTETLIGAEFWDGAIGSTATDPDTQPWPNTWLANVADVDILTESGPTGLVHGLACLEQYAASHNGGQQAAIHATSQVVTHWESFRLLRREGNRILTFKDTVVIPSPGYSGNNPNGGIDDGDVWAYVTDMPRIYLGPVNPVQIARNDNDRDNDVVAHASRLALVEWERCRHGGVRLAIDLCDTGGS